MYRKTIKNNAKKHLPFYVLWDIITHSGKEWCIVVKNGVKTTATARKRGAVCSWAIQSYS